MSFASNSIYAIEQSSPSVSWDEREAIPEALVEAALGANVPGGSHVYAWLPMADGHTIHDTARDVMRSALAAAFKAANASAPNPLNATSRQSSCGTAQALEDGLRMEPEE
jgi:hypothetical protein